ncbi:unnamed protein product [Rhizophagus irregularis]|nr:unnamed protein product [Rhizophagus irregularis]
MDISNQNLDTTKTDAKNLWKEIDNAEYQYNATIFSADSTTESDETTSLLLKRVNIMDLEKRKEVYGLCGECNEPGNIGHWDIENQKWIRGSRKVALKSLNNSSNISNDFLNEIKYYISGHFPAYGLSGFRPKISEDTPKLIVDLIIKCWDAKAENRPTTKELRQILEKYLDDVDDEEPVNSTNYLSSFQEPISSSSTNLISERLDCELNELDLDE